MNPMKNRREPHQSQLRGVEFPPWVLSQGVLAAGAAEDAVPPGGPKGPFGELLKVDLQVVFVWGGCLGGAVVFFPNS